MGKRLIALLAGLMVLFAVGCEEITTPVSAPAEGLQETQEMLPSGTPVEGRYIVVFKETAVSLSKSQAAMASLARSVLVDNNVAVREAERVYTHALRGFVAGLSEEEAARIAADPRIDYIEQDRVIALAPPPGKGKPDKDDSDKSQPQVVPWGITRVGGNGDGNSKIAWVIDTGIDFDHKDLNADVSRSVNFVTRGRPSPKDGNGHGTHVAGTIAALDNAIDVVGVAAGAAVVAVRVLDNSGSGYYSWVIAGVDYVAQNGSTGDVANMSLSGPVSQALDDAVLTAAGRGIRFALAAGNSGVYAGDSSPARVNHTNVYTVSAIDNGDTMPYWSNWGNPPVDYAAPGVSILSTKKGGGTTVMNGTSMAAPHMAGLLLLGSVSSDGSALNDPDGNPDPIAHR